MGFRHVYVFDVSQTEGGELPALSGQITRSVGGYRVGSRFMDGSGGTADSVNAGAAGATPAKPPAKK